MYNGSQVWLSAGVPRSSISQRTHRSEWRPPHVVLTGGKSNSSRYSKCNRRPSLHTSHAMSAPPTSEGAKKAAVRYTSSGMLSYVSPRWGHVRVYAADPRQARTLSPPDFWGEGTTASMPPPPPPRLSSLPPPAAASAFHRPLPPPPPVAHAAAAAAAAAAVARPRATFQPAPRALHPDPSRRLQIQVPQARVPQARVASPYSPTSPVAPDVWMEHPPPPPPPVAAAARPRRRRVLAPYALPPDPLAWRVQGRVPREPVPQARVASPYSPYSPTSPPPPDVWTEHGMVANGDDDDASMDIDVPEEVGVGRAAGHGEPR
jgi:hypothetical protein